MLSTTAIATNTGLPIFDAGVIPQSSSSFSYCSAGAFTDAAGCSGYLDKDALKERID